MMIAATCLSLALSALQLAASPLAASASSVPPDLVVLNARIWTGEPDGAEPVALAAGGGVILALGDNDAVLALAGDQTRILDAGGRRLIPGLTDSHTHIISGGLMLAQLNLRDVADKDAFIRAVAEEAKRKKRGEWIRGGRWSVESWKQPQPPTRAWLDPVTGDLPVFLQRMDGHQALVNSAALKRAGITASGPPDPKGGEIQRDPATGEPTGILKDAAMDLVSRHIPASTLAELREALLRAMRHLNSLGITGVHDMCEPEHLAIFLQAHKEGSLTVRIHAFLSTEDWARGMETAAAFPVRDDWLRLAGLKGYMDGSLGSRNAYMREPFADAAPDAKYPRGQLTDFADPPTELNERVALADARGLQLAVHAIGDEANHLILDAYEAAAQAKGPHDARHRVEHAQHLLTTDIPRFARLGVVASMQPFHKADDGRYAEKALGTARLAGSYAFRPLLDAGAVVAFGSDWPVVTADPFAGMDAAVNSRTLAGEVWQAQNAITVREALVAYTRSPAWAAHMEAKLGTLRVGKLADFVVLSEDLLTIPPDRIASVHVWMTVVGGRVVCSHKEP